MSKMSKNSMYAFEIVTWTNEKPFTIIPVVTYFVECDHFPDSAFIDEFILNDFKKAKLEHDNSCYILNRSGFKQYECLHCMADTCWSRASKLYLKHTSNGKNITTYVEYVNIRKISD